MSDEAKKLQFHSGAPGEDAPTANDVILCELQRQKQVRVRGEEALSDDMDVDIALCPLMFHPKRDRAELQRQASTLVDMPEPEVLAKYERALRAAAELHLAMRALWPLALRDLPPGDETLAYASRGATETLISLAELETYLYGDVSPEHEQEAML